MQTANVGSLVTILILHGVWRRCFRAKNQFLFEMVQKDPDGSKRVLNGQKPLGWSFWSLFDSFLPLWNVDKPAMFGHFGFWSWCQIVLPPFNFCAPFSQDRAGICHGWQGRSIWLSAPPLNHDESSVHHPTIRPVNHSRSQKSIGVQNHNIFVVI